MRHLAATAALAVLLAGCGGEDRMGAGPDFEYMNEVMQTRAEVIWESAGYVITAEGERDLSPTTDEGWAAVAAGAQAIKDAGEELKTVPWAPKDDNWPAFADGIVRMGEQARLAAEAHDADGVFEAGAQLYEVCIACHRFYRAGEFAEE